MPWELSHRSPAFPVEILISGGPSPPGRQTPFCLPGIGASLGTEGAPATVLALESEASCPGSSVDWLSLQRSISGRTGLIL